MTTRASRSTDRPAPGTRIYPALVLAATLLAAPVAADECVNPGGSGGCHASIQAAIDAALPGDTIDVAAGFYAERLLITKPLTLLGAQAGVDPTPSGTRTNPVDESILDINSLPLVNPNIAIRVPAGGSDVTIDGFTLIGSPIPHWADEVVIRADDDNLVMRNDIFDAFVGVLYRGGGRVTVENNRFTVNKNGVVALPAGSTDLRVLGNTFALGSMPSGDPSAVQLTAIFGGLIADNVVNGFVGGRGAGGSDLHDLTITGNTFTGGKDSISIFGGSTFVDITDNLLADNTRHGINIKGADLTIARNEITNNGDSGINLDRHVIDTERVVISCNKISGNAIFGLKVDDADVPVAPDAVGNWWGDPTGPFHPVLNPSGLGDAVSDGADFDPWLLTASAAEFVPCGSTMLIDLRPGNAHNQINTNSHQLVPIAILAAAEFDPCDPASLDPETIRVRGAAPSATRFRCEDANGDGLDDLVVRIRARAMLPPTEEECADPDATILLTASDGSGNPLDGTDSVTWLNCD